MKKQKVKGELIEVSPTKCAEASVKAEKVILPDSKVEDALIDIKQYPCGEIIGDKVVVEKDFQLAQPFYDKGSFGEIAGVKTPRMEFAMYEALYLLERGKIRIFSGKKELSMAEFVKKAEKVETAFWTRYNVYKELRTRGYVLKTALKFGADFRVYMRGVKPGDAHAKWVLFCADEKGILTWRQFSAMNRVAHSTRKKLLVGVVDEESDVTYYEIRWKKP